MATATQQESKSDDESSMPSTINQCTSSQLALLLQTHDTFNDKNINQWKQQIIEYIENNDIDGNTILNTKRKEFSQSLVDLYNDKKIRRAANKTHDRLKSN